MTPMKRWFFCSLAMLLAMLLASGASRASATVTVQDDDGRSVTLPQPARRIVALAPHATELLFAAGGGAHIVGVVSYSDYPPAATRIMRIGDSNRIDLERVLALRPDLIVAWPEGNAQGQTDALRALGIPVFNSTPRTLGQIADSVQRLGQLMGTDDVARPAAAKLQRELAALTARHQGQRSVRLFYQVWDRPLYTLNGKHIVSAAIRLCGGENIFAGLSAIAPVVGIEAVLQQDPEAIVGSGEKSTGIDLWRNYPHLQAVRAGHLFALDGNLLNRPGPRMIAGTAALCEKLDLVRQDQKK
jgi:iron complex transport system substrate-binding protein